MHEISNIYLTAVFVPSDKSPPFVVAAYLGKGKPAYEFFDDLIKEMTHLSQDADEEAEAGSKRTCVVEILCMICDSPVRFWLTGEFYQTAWQGVFNILN